MADIDDEHDLTHISESEYQAKIRRAEQLSTCPCTNCIDRCWDTDAITECEPYRKWWRIYHGVKYGTR